jgi:hypothetical protein
MNSRRIRLTTTRMKISDSRMPRIVQAASTPGIVSRAKLDAAPYNDEALRAVREGRSERGVKGLTPRRS